MRILSIESSCDETAAAIVFNGIKVESNIIASSRKAFESTGGVIPEDAARRQVECVLPVIHQAMEGVIASHEEIDAIAVTRGPGLLGSLLVGTTCARALGQLWGKPVIGVHHTLGHLSSTWLDIDVNNPPTFPILTLSASGGHTELWLRTSHTKGTLIGRTRDDAAGEAFDKGATLLGLPYPGGPSISLAGENGDPHTYKFPLPLQKEQTLDFSFSGLKTALRYTIRDLPNESQSAHNEPQANESTNQPINQTTLSNLAASYEYAICRYLLDRIAGALLQYPTIREVHVVGGVSANKRLRTMIKEIAGDRIIRFPQHITYCTDNAAMIGAAAEFMVQEWGEKAFVDFKTEASLGLEMAVGE